MNAADLMRLCDLLDQREHLAAKIRRYEVYRYQTGAGCVHSIVDDKLAMHRQLLADVGSAMLWSPK